MSGRGLLGGQLGFLKGDLEDLVISDIMDHLISPQGRYPESCMMISIIEVCQEGGSRRGVLGGR